MELSTGNLQSSNRLQLTIAHLNNDCLEKVFSYLSLTELAYVAESNVHLAISAQSLYGHLNRGKEFRFNCYEKKLSDEVFLLVLQHFGKCISKLRVNFSVEKQRNQIIFDTLVENCRTTLTELTLLGMGEELKLNHPFPVLEKLELWDCIFGMHKSMTNINQWFPNLSSAKFYNIPDFWEKTFSIEYFPNLQSFGYLTFPQQHHTNATLSKLAQFLYLNPQLKCLELDELLKSGKEIFNKLAPTHLPNIERLEVVSPYPFPCGTIQFNKLKELALSIYRDTADIFNQLPRTIECFELRMQNISASAINYILSCTALKKLKIQTSQLESSCLERMAKESHALTEVHVKFTHSTEIIDFQTLAGLEHFFLQRKQMETITLEFELNSFEQQEWNYDSQLELARAFTTRINDTLKPKWKLSHKIHNNEDDHRTHDLFVYPYLVLSFKNRNSH